MKKRVLGTRQLYIFLSAKDVHNSNYKKYILYKCSINGSEFSAHLCFYNFIKRTGTVSTNIRIYIPSKIVKCLNLKARQTVEICIKDAKDVENIKNSRGTV